MHDSPQNCGSSPHVAFIPVDSTLGFCWTSGEGGGMTVRREVVKIVLGAVVLAPSGIAVLTIDTPKGQASSSSMAPLPDPGTYIVDPAHTFAYFGAMHHIVGLVRGRFDKVTGTISAAKEPADCAVDISIDTASIDTQVAKRDEDLRGPDFFDVKNFPAMTYRGRGIRKSADDAWVMDGLLTIRGVTKEVPLTFRFKGLFPDMPAGQPARTSFHASAAVKRGDFGMTRDNLMELGPNPKRPDVEIEIDAEANASTPAK
jgi:polyisoprenoid-binding protein YceI